MPEPIEESFATIPQADAYHASQLFGTKWADLEDETKQTALNTATQRFNDSVLWNATLLESLANGVVPVSLINATSEFARVLVERGDPAAPSKTEGMKKLKAGPVDLEFNPTIVDRTPVAMIPAYILAMISHLIMLAPTEKVLMSLGPSPR